MRSRLPSFQSYHMLSLEVSKRNRQDVGKFLGIVPKTGAPLSDSSALSIPNHHAAGLATLCQAAFQRRAGLEREPQGQLLHARSGKARAVDPEGSTGGQVL